jgi:hypothetical protein
MVTVSGTWPIVGVTGVTSPCVNGTTTLSPTTGGTWISNNTGVATVTNAGVVTAISAGEATFTFTDSTTGCSNTTPKITVHDYAVETDITLSDMTICWGKTASLTPVASGGITNPVFYWYNSQTSTTPIATTNTPPYTYTTSVLTANTTYYVGVAGDDYCENAINTRKEVTITVVTGCTSPYGTVFPFVHTGRAIFDNQFITTAKLYAIPPAGTPDKIGYIRTQTPIYTALVNYYDCTTDAPMIGAPKYPGAIGNTDNPGFLIRWNALGIVKPGIPNAIKLTATDKCPAMSIGKYIFENVSPGDYVLEISRQGFLSRYGVVTIGSNNYLGHRELLAGDVNGDDIIDIQDFSDIQSQRGTYGTLIYSWGNDFNGDLSVNSNDVSIIGVNLNADNTIYQETEDFIH